MRTSTREGRRESAAAIAPREARWTSLRMESRRRFHVARAWIGNVLPAALATARSGALGDAALLVARSLRPPRRPRRRRESLAA